MIKHSIAYIITLLLAFNLQAQSAKKDGFFYFSFGTHRAFYSKSDIRLVRNAAPDFDFTIYKVKAHDDWALGTAPQYSYNIGYYSHSKKIGIEYHFDHLKYKVQQNQAVHVKGYIGTDELDKDTVLGRDFVKLEHTDGANYAMLNLVKFFTLAESKDGIRKLDLFIKAGGGIVVPKTNSTILGVHNDDHYALSGYVLGVEPGIRYNFLKNFFAQAGFKGAYANYNHFRIAYGYGRQQWYSAQVNLMAGLQFGH
ncbi:MAG: hypothetical protein ACXWV0_06675 [Flavisolibacter sp.]